MGARTFVYRTAFCSTSAIGTTAGAPAAATVVATIPTAMVLVARAADWTVVFCSGVRLSIMHARIVHTYSASASSATAGCDGGEDGSGGE